MKKLIAAILALAVFAPAAAAASRFVKVSPGSVAAGQSVRVYGTVTSCPTRNKVTITSKAFKGAKHTFAHVPALLLKQNRQHKFSGNVTLTSTLMAGNYTVTARCGGGSIFGHTKLTVTPGFY